ncbi:hypothetical protein ABT104_15385 [Streptomyces mobaraensis]|uniref:hypothetical protein n=1 Tax=Streptomyces mobaraensis TaxID=35621 RepID=UPI00331A0895
MLSVRSPSPFLTFAMVALAGAFVGVSGPMFLSADGVGHALHLTLSAGWMYAAVAFFAGMVGMSKKRSAVMGVVSLVAAVIAYYLAKLEQGKFTQADLADHTGQTTYVAWGDMLSVMAFWCFVACLLGSLLGIAGNCSLSGPLHLPARLLVPTIAVYDTSNHLGDFGASSFEATVWGTTRVLAIAVIVAVVVHAIFSGRRRKSVRRPKNAKCP